MASVIYTKTDGIGRKIIPAPLVSIAKSYETDGEGTKRGSNYAITLTGTFLPFMGSPSGSYASLDQAFYSLGGYPPNESYAGGEEDFNHILRKQEALRWLFSEDGGILEWQPSSGQPPVKCYPRILSVNFPEGQWADRCQYTVELEAPWVYINGTLDTEDNIAQDLITGSDETWSFEDIAGRERSQYRVTHDISADGKLGYDGAGGQYGNKAAWEHAKDFVDARVTGGVDSDVMFAALGASGQVTGHYNKIVRINQSDGTYGVTEEWLLSDDATYEERQFTVDYNQDQDEYSITYQGTIHGVVEGSDNGSVSNLNQARSAIPSVSEARTTAIEYVGSLIGTKSLPVSPDKSTFAMNQGDGTVVFTYQWNTSENTTFLTTDEAQHSYSTDNRLNTLTLTQTVDGKGESASDRLANAKAAVYTDEEAVAVAKSLADTDLAYTLSSTVHAFDERKGSVRSSWTWTDRDANSTETTVQKQLAAAIFATIPIPGRAAGPIVQNMNTQSSEVITVTIRSRRNESEPSLDTEAYGEDGSVIADSTNWSPETGVASRTTRFLKET